MLSSLANDSGGIFLGNSDGIFSNTWSGFNNAVRPTLYLSSSVKTTSGDGGIDSPYKLSL